MDVHASDVAASCDKDHASMWEHEYVELRAIGRRRMRLHSPRALELAERRAKERVAEVAARLEVSGLSVHQFFGESDADARMGPRLSATPPALGSLAPNPRTCSTPVSSQASQA